MLLWWLYILVSQLASFACVSDHAAMNTTTDIESIKSSNSLSETHSLYYYLPCSHRLTDQGLSYESTKVNTCVENKNFKDYNPYKVYNISKLYINITYILPVNPMVGHHWICKIQV